MAQDSGKTGKKPRGPGRRFKPGQSGNPGGRPKVPDDVVEACRALTSKAIKTLEHCMESAKSEAVRVRAAEALLDRAWGRATTPIDATVKASVEGKVLIYMPDNGRDK